MNHREATALAKTMECFMCGDTPCEPVHWPKHRGMGGDESMWEYGEHWIPGCRMCHRKLDKTAGDSDEQFMARICASFRRTAIVCELRRGET